MKRFAQYFLLSIFVTALGACVPVPVVVDSQGTGYSQPVYTDQYDYDDYGYGYDEDYYEVPVVYGEPVYYPPPVSVTFAYDYYTYEIVGGYVDVVFWRGGHRYRHEPWYDQGRRITPGHIHSREFRHKIRGSELYQHRKKLREKHNIYHSHDYYGVKPSSKIQQQKQKILRDRERQEQDQQKLLRERQQQERERQIQSRERERQEQDQQRLLRERQQQERERQIQSRDRERQEQEKQKQLRKKQEQDQDQKRLLRERQFQERVKENQMRDYQKQEQKKQKQLREYQQQEQEKQKQLKDRQQKELEKRQQEREKKSKERGKKSDQDQQPDDNERSGRRH